METCIASSVYFRRYRLAFFHTPFLLQAVLRSIKYGVPKRTSSTTASCSTSPSRRSHAVVLWKCGGVVLVVLCKGLLEVGCRLSHDQQLETLMGTPQHP